jgi:hypothetical protein
MRDMPVNNSATDQRPVAALPSTAQIGFRDG